MSYIRFFSKKNPWQRFGSGHSGPGKDAQSRPPGHPRCRAPLGQAVKTKECVKKTPLMSFSDVCLDIFWMCLFFLFFFFGDFDVTRSGKKQQHRAFNMAFCTAVTQNCHALLLAMLLFLAPKVMGKDHEVQTTNQNKYVYIIHIHIYIYIFIYLFCFTYISFIYIYVYVYMYVYVFMCACVCQIPNNVNTVSTTNLAPTIEI